MPHNMYIYVRSDSPLDSATVTVTVAHDAGWSATGSYTTSTPDARPGWTFSVPDSVPNSNGAVVSITAPGMITNSTRGLLYYLHPDRAYMMCDDFTLVPVPAPTPIPEPPEPTGPPTNEPLDIINWVYSSGKYNLALHTDCGKFTEECCTELHRRNNQTWGHIKKEPGQNQYNGHAVDAVQCLGGSENGIWDIIVSSVSTSAKPAYNRAGDAKPELWYYPADAQDMHTMLIVAADNIKAYVRKQFSKK